MPATVRCNRNLKLSKPFGKSQRRIEPPLYSPQRLSDGTGTAIVRARS